MLCLCLAFRTWARVPKYSHRNVFHHRRAVSFWTAQDMSGPGASPSSLPDRIRLVLATRGLSLAQVSRASQSLAKGNGRYHVPHNFYSALRKPQFSPSLYQLLALSIVSGYRLVDWFQIFGFSLDHVARFQASFPAIRTVELDSRIYHPQSPVPGLEDLQQPDFLDPLVPLSRWLVPGAAARVDSLRSVTRRKFRYVKIGLQDAFAFPELLPGSIVRVNAGLHARRRKPIGERSAENLFLLEHSRGLVCSVLDRAGPGRLVLCSRHLPYAPVELQLETQANVLGVVDAEIRPLGNIEQPVVPAWLGRYWSPSPLAGSGIVQHAGAFIQRARKRSGLSFREASQRTRAIARTLKDSRYYCSAASLSDCETRKLPPRHIQKLLSICAVYFASPAELLEASGVNLNDGGQIPMPPQLLGRLENVRPDSRPSLFLNEVERRFGEIPYFLHSVAPSLFGLPDLSLRDLFWAGDHQTFVHAHLAGTVFLVVDRRQKIPRPSLSCPKWAQPLYVLQRRNGSNLFGYCSLQNGLLILRPAVAGLPRLLRLRNRIDAEIVGRVVGLVRSFTARAARPQKVLKANADKT
jgi:Helix-turn-helix domain